MPGQVELQPPTDRQMAMAERMAASLTRLRKPDDLAAYWESKGLQVRRSGGAAVLELGAPEGRAVVLWAPAPDGATLTALSELPELLLETEAGSLVVIVGEPTEPVPEGLLLRVESLALASVESMRWPWAPAWGPAGSQLQVSGGWGARNLVRELARQGRAVGAVSVRGLLWPTDLLSPTTEVARISNRGRWTPVDGVDAEPLPLALGTQALAGMIDGLLLHSGAPVGWLTWRTWLAVFSAAVLVYLGRLIWTLLDMGEDLLADRDAGHLEALGAPGQAVEEQLRRGELDGLKEALERAEVQDRFIWLDLLAERTPLRAVSSWVESEPDNLLAVELMAWRRYALAREVMGPSGGQGMTAEALEARAREVALAHEALDRAQALQPGLGAHGGLRLSLAVIARDTWPEQLAIFDAGRADAPDSYALWQAMLSAAEAHHGPGSPELQRLAREGSRGAPVGSPLWALVAQAHVTRFEHLCDQDVEDPEDYLQEPVVMGELQHAFDAFHEGGPQGPEARLAYGWFLTALQETEETSRLEAAHEGARSA